MVGQIRAYARELGTTGSSWKWCNIPRNSKGLGAKFKFLLGENFMKRTLMKLTLAPFALAALAAVGLAEQQSRTVLRKIDHQALLDAVPGIPETSAEAGKRAYGQDMKAQDESIELDSFYDTLNKRLAVTMVVL